MAEVNRAAMSLFIGTDPKQAHEFFSAFMQGLFPEIDLFKDRETTDKERMKELKEFSLQELSLEPITGAEGYRLKVGKKR